MASRFYCLVVVNPGGNPVNPANGEVEPAEGGDRLTSETQNKLAVATFGVGQTGVQEENVVVTSGVRILDGVPHCEYIRMQKSI